MNHLLKQDKKIKDFIGDLNSWESVKDDSFITMTHPKNRQTPDQLRKVLDHEKRVKLNQELLQQINEKLKMKE